MTLKKSIALVNALLLGIYLLTFGQSYAQTPSEFRNFSETLLKKYGLEPGLHTVLVSNCSYMMKNLVTVKDLSNIEKMTQIEIQHFLFNKGFWGQKLQREISIPYSDIEFHQFLADLQLEINDFIKYLNTVNVSSSRFELKIFGSMAKARFGVNSSLDILIHSNDRDLLSKLDHGIYSDSHPKFRGNIKLITSKNEAYFLLDPFHVVTTGELSNLAKIYEDILELNNLEVKHLTNTFNITFRNLPPKLNLEFNAIEDRMFFLLKKLYKLQHAIENSTEIFIPAQRANQTKTKQYFSDQLRDLGTDLKTVKADLKLIIEKKKSDRHEKIKAIIKPASYARLKGYRGQRMLSLIEKKLTLLQKTLLAIR